MELVYRFFLKLKYKKALNFLDQFYDIYQSHWGEPLDLQTARKIEEDVLGKLLQDDQRIIDIGILNNPIIVAQYIKVEKQILNEGQDNYFVNLKTEYKRMLLEYLLALKKESIDKIAKLKVILDNNLDFTKIPDHYFQMEVIDLKKELDEIEIDFF